MVNLEGKNNALHLQAELEWFRKVVTIRYQLHHKQKCEYADIGDVRAPNLNDRASHYREYVEKLGLKTSERIVLMLAVMPHIHPHLLDDILNDSNVRFRVGIFSEAIAPPVKESALFILAGDDLEKRFNCEGLFKPDAPLFREKMLYLDEDGQNRNPSNVRLIVDPEFLARCTGAASYQPVFGHGFPAKRLTTSYKWDELVLCGETREQIDEIQKWIEYGDALMNEWELNKKFPPGLKCLFFGPPGTGKTLTAALLGKTSNMDVYRIDLSLVISKYIGETEKNLKAVFDIADNKNWILFFDEADALFGKRTEIRDAHDRYANQEVSYLLHRIEDHAGIVILATNKRGNLDEAFTRRFQNIVHFPMPGEKERFKLWKNGFSSRCEPETEVDFENLASKYELSGGTIMNAIRYASLMAISSRGKFIRHADILKGIQKEYKKEGKSL